MLAELAEQTDYLVRLWGTVRDNSVGLPELELSRWQAIPEAGGLPTFYGKITLADGQTWLLDEANRTRYLLPEAPAALKAEDAVAVAGWPETAADTAQLIWQKISVYPQTTESEPVATSMPLTAVSVGSVELVYRLLSGSATGRSQDLLVPMWQFAGTGDNGEQVTVWVTAVFPDFFPAHNP